MFDFHLDYDIMVTKEIITARMDFHKSFAQCFVSEVSLPFLRNKDYPKSSLLIG